MVQETQPLKTQVPVRCRWSVFVNRRDHVDIITRSWQTTTVAVDKEGVGGSNVIDVGLDGLVPSDADVESSERSCVHAAISQSSTWSAA